MEIMRRINCLGGGSQEMYVQSNMSKTDSRTFGNSEVNKQCSLSACVVSH